jgi:hypothetical protein
VTEASPVTAGRRLLSLVLVAGGVFLGLRLVHLAIPVFYPQVLSGPFSVDRFEEVERYSGFSPLTPYYRPELLGERAVNITVSRRPEPAVVVFWQGERFLRLTQRLGGPSFPPGRGARPVPGRPDATWWMEGKTRFVVLDQDGLRLELRTDLALEDTARVVRTLRRFDRLR